jgi:hypothetical protein
MLKKIKNKMRIIASLTTTPYRIDLIKPTIDSILNQTIPIDAIELNIPQVFLRTGEIYKIPDWLSILERDSNYTNCKISIFRTEDYGAITKVAPTLLRYKNAEDAFIWSVDDDFVYPVNMLATLYREYIPTKHRLLSHSGGNWTYDSDKLNCINYNTHRMEGVVDFFEGFAGVLYPPSLIKDDFENYVIDTSKLLDNRNSDDILLSNYFALQNIKMYNCYYPYSNNRQFLNLGKQNYGTNNDALHKQDGGHNKRYIRVFNWLKENNLNGWIKKSNEI